MHTVYKKQPASFVMLILAFCMSACGQKTSTQHIPAMKTNTTNDTVSSNNLDTATFGAGCFWCVEAVFQQLKGVKEVASGYSGGAIDNPTYKEVCTGMTGHAEVCRIVYDPKEINFPDLLQAFWLSHDPTTLNRQGNDVGTQYRSVIYYHNEQQKELAEKYKQELDSSGAYPRPIVTEISPAVQFFKAEDYHQNYFNENGEQPYCQYVIQPKIDKFRKVFANKLK